MDVAVEAFSGAAGGVVGRCLAFPFETLKQRRTREPDCAVLDVLKEGPAALYRGVHWSAVEAWNSKGFQFMAVTKLRNLYRAFTGRNANTNLFVAIMIGYIADVLSLWNTITFENIIARLQTDPKGFSLRKEILSVGFARKVLSQLPVYLILALRPGIEHGLFDVFKHLWLKRRNQNGRTRVAATRSPRTPGQTNVGKARHVRINESPSFITRSTTSLNDYTFERIVLPLFGEPTTTEPSPTTSSTRSRSTSSSSSPETSTGRSPGTRAKKESHPSSQNDVPIHCRKPDYGRLPVIARCKTVQRKCDPVSGMVADLGGSRGGSCPRPPVLGSPGESDDSCRIPEDRSTSCGSASGSVEEPEYCSSADDTSHGRMVPIGAAKTTDNDGAHLHQQLAAREEEPLKIACLVENNNSSFTLGEPSDEDTSPFYSDTEVEDYYRHGMAYGYSNSSSASSREHSRSNSSSCQENWQNHAAPEMQGQAFSARLEYGFDVEGWSAGDANSGAWRKNSFANETRNEFPRVPIRVRTSGGPRGLTADHFNFFEMDEGGDLFFDDDDDLGPEVDAGSAEVDSVLTNRDGLAGAVPLPAAASGVTARASCAESPARGPGLQNGFCSSLWSIGGATAADHHAQQGTNSLLDLPHSHCTPRNEDAPRPFGLTAVGSSRHRVSTGNGNKSSRSSTTNLSPELLMPAPPASAVCCDVLEEKPGRVLVRDYRPDHEAFPENFFVDVMSPKLQEGTAGALLPPKGILKKDTGTCSSTAAAADPKFDRGHGIPRTASLLRATPSVSGDLHRLEKTSSAESSVCSAESGGDGRGGERRFVVEHAAGGGDMAGDDTSEWNVTESEGFSDDGAWGRGAAGQPAARARHNDACSWGSTIRNGAKYVYQQLRVGFPGAPDAQSGRGSCSGTGTDQRNSARCSLRRGAMLDIAEETTEHDDFDMLHTPVSAAAIPTSSPSGTGRPLVCGDGGKDQHGQPQSQLQHHLHHDTRGQIAGGPTRESTTISTTKKARSRTNSKSKTKTALSLPPVAAFLLGACARFVATLFVYPYIRVKTLAISQKGALKAGDDRGRVSYTQMLLRTLKNEGFFALYTGAGFELSRGVSQSAVMFLVMETLRVRVRRLMQLLWSRWQSVA